MASPLKRIASATLVLIILLNTMGYYIMFLGLHYQNNLAMTRALASGVYDPSQSLMLKVPVSLPYMPDQSDYEIVNGKFEYNGELYRLVKQRYAKDTLTVVCVKDSEHKKINQALGDYVKSFTDKTRDTKSTSKIRISFLKEYLPFCFALDSATKGWSIGVTHRSHDRGLITTLSAPIVQPPEKT